IRMVLPRSFLTGPPPRNPEFVLERAFRPWLAARSEIFAGSAGGPAFFCTNAPTRHQSHSGPFCPPKGGQNSGQIRPSPVPQPAIGVVLLEPCQGASGRTDDDPHRTIQS